MVRLIIGCGYLGRRVADRWLAVGDTVHALTRSRSRAAQLREQGVIPVLGDVMHPGSLMNLPDADTVLYAVGYDRASPHTRHEVYVTGLQNVLESLPPPTRRFIYVSSTSVYGQSEGEWVDEDSPRRPTKANGQTCLAAETRVSEAFGDAASGTLTVLRMAGLYGPDRLIGRLQSLRAGEPLNVNPAGWLNLIHVDDAATTVIVCADETPPRPTYLVSDDCPLQRGTFYRHLAELAGAPFPVFAATDDLPSDLGKRCCNARLHEELGVRLAFPDIQTGLPDALARTDPTATL